MVMVRASTAKDTADSSARNAYVVTPHDTNEIGTYEPKFIYVGTAGTGALVYVPEGSADGTAITLTGIAAGTFLPIVPRIIKATGTGVSNILAFY